jgi:diacylglycerol O-acyltransferase / wax synthase
MCRPFEADRPPWHFYYVSHYEGGSALIGRIHHAIGDGLALIHVILSMSDQAPTRRPPPAPAADDEEASRGRRWPGRSVASSTRRSRFRGGAQRGRAVAGEPHACARDDRADGRGDRRPHEARGDAARPGDPVQGGLTNRKRVVWSRPISVADLKRVGRLTGSTINDVLMAGLSGALRRYLLERGDRCPPRSTCAA